MIIILDLGANDGSSIRKFKKEYLNNEEDYMIYSFEPHPFFEKYLYKESIEDERVIIINKASSTYNSNKCKLYYSKKNDGSTLNKTKTTNGINEKNYIYVQCLDIAEFIKTLKIEYGDELWIKMDIEGEEYNIIPHLYENNLIKCIDKLFIEWHYKKLKNVTYEHHKKCVDYVRNIKIYYWDAFEYSIQEAKEEYRKTK